MKFFIAIQNSTGFFSRGDAIVVRAYHKSHSTPLGPAPRTFCWQGEFPVFQAENFCKHLPVLLYAAKFLPQVKFEVCFS